jgi:hypothetical protein
MQTKNFFLVPNNSRPTGDKIGQSGHPDRHWFGTGLPDFSLYKIPKREKYIPNYHELYQMCIKYNKRP